MKQLLLPVIALLALSAPAQQLLRIRGGIEETASVPTDLPASVTNAYAAQLYAAGYRPVETSTNAPSASWCTRVVRTLTLTNDVWRVEWIEAPVPVPLNPAALVDTLLALPDGTNKLATVMSIPAVADWFVADPVYVRGSDLALALGTFLGLDQASLEEVACKALADPRQGP